MLLKLLKYDFRSMWKQFAIIWPAALVIGLLNRFTVFGGDHWDTSPSGVVGVTTMMLLAAVLAAMGVVSLVFILQRFYKGLLGDEGYLMHTLPVRPWQLITSKLICAIVVVVISTAAAVLALVLMVPVDWGEFFRSGLMEDMVIIWNRVEPGDVLYLVEFCLVMLAGLISGVLLLYLCMALGHLFQKHRVAMSVAAFVLLNIVVTNLLSGINRVVMPYMPYLEGGGHAVCWSAIGTEVLLGVLYFLGTNLILSKKLNLE